MKKVLGLLGLLLGVLACGPNPRPSSNLDFESPKNQPQIFGGSRVENHPVQYSTVALLLSDGGGALCTGVLISEKVLLTAAHCVEKNFKQTKVFFGKNLNQRERITRAVVHGVRHPGYNSKASKNQKDIGILILDEPAPEPFRSLELLPSEQILNDGQMIKVFGFGISWPLPGREKEKKGAGVLREVDLEIKDANYAETEISLEQGPVRGGVCYADSGGPAIVHFEGRDYLWGLSSRARGAFFASCIVDSVFTRVDKYVPWIEEVLNQYTQANEF